MNETVTVDQALSRGRKMISYPIGVIFIGIIAVNIYLIRNYGLPDWSLAIGLLFSGLLAILYSSVAVTKWQIWAFENVQNVHELKRKAIAANLMPADNSAWAWVYVKSTADKERLAAIQEKFEAKDVHADDILVPGETIIYYSKGASLGGMAFMLLLACTGIFFLVTHSYLIGVLLTGFGGYFSYSFYGEVKKAMNKIPQIILNANGIQTATTPFYDWKQISGEQVLREVSVSGKHISVNYYLAYHHPGGDEKLNLEDLTTDSKQLEHLLETYRARADKRKGQ